MKGCTMKGKALFIGNSDGIGLAATRALLREGWTITGISRSESPVRDPSYRHSVFKGQRIYRKTQNALKAE